jgi:hypothetical protein
MGDEISAAQQVVKKAREAYEKAASAYLEAVAPTDEERREAYHSINDVIAFEGVDHEEIIADQVMGIRDYDENVRVHSKGSNINLNKKDCDLMTIDDDGRTMTFQCRVCKKVVKQLGDFYPPQVACPGKYRRNYSY